jgi:hypothetical protein
MENDSRTSNDSEVEVRATALFVPAGVDSETLNFCMGEIRKYNDERGVRTDWGKPYSTN